jgi:hypothetical protein
MILQGAQKEGPRLLAVISVLPIVRSTALETRSDEIILLVKQQTTLICTFGLLITTK